MKNIRPSHWVIVSLPDSSPDCPGLSAKVQLGKSARRLVIPIPMLLQIRGAKVVSNLLNQLPMSSLLLDRMRMARQCNCNGELKTRSYRFDIFDRLDLIVLNILIDLQIFDRQVVAPKRNSPEQVCIAKSRELSIYK